MVVEKNIPSLFSTMQLMLSGALLNAVYHQSLKKGIANGQCKFWKFLSVLFYGLAIDEWFTIHDTLGHFFSNKMGAVGDFFGWTLLFIILLPIFGLFSVRFLIALPKKIAILFICSGGLFISGAIGLELLNTSGLQQLLNIDVTPSGMYFIGLFEESFEIIAIFLFNLTIFMHGSSTLDIYEYKLSKRWVIGVFIFGWFDIVGTIVNQFF